MTKTLKAASHATQGVREHVGNAVANLEEFRLLGINAYGILMNPASQRAVLRAAHDELAHAIAIMEATAWPNEQEYHAL